MEHIKEFFETRDKFAKYVGIEIVEIDKGKATVKLDIDERHLNGVNIVHGAVLFSIADYAFAIASNSYGDVAVSINANISFIKAVSSGTIYAEAKEQSRNPKLATYLINVTNEKGELLATFHGMVYIKKQKLEDIK